MSIYAKPVSQITSDDLQELLIENAVENVRLEFKREIPNRGEMLKKLSSFANTFGGDLVIGAAAASADGRVTDLPGVDVQSGFKQTVVQWCFAGTMPPIITEVSDPITMPGDGGRVCYVIRTAESEMAPHFLNGRNGAYVRTDEFSSLFKPQLATENELQQLLGRRQLIRDRRASLVNRARERFSTFASRSPAQQADSRDQFDARFEVAVLPRFPASPVCKHPKLMKVVKEATLPWRQTAFPRNSPSAIAQHESAIILKPCGQRSFFEANVWGLAYYSAPIGERSRDCTGIHTNEFIGYLLAFLHHARMLLQLVGYAGPLHVELLMHGIRNVPWVSFPRGVAETGPNSELDNTVTFTLDATTDELNEECDRLASDLLQYVFCAVNWLEVADTEEKLARLVSTGYEFNYWPRSPTA